MGLRRTWNDVVLHEATPGKVTFRVGDADLAVELDKSRVLLNFPKADLKDFVGVVQPFVDNIKGNLEIEDYSRIGLRLIFGKNFGSLGEATAALASLNRIALPTEKFFGLDGDPKSIDFAVRWETPKIGSTVRLKTESETLQVTPAPAHKRDLEAIKKERHKFIYDVDYYTVAAVNATQWRAADWIESVFHTIRRDSHNFLEGR